MHQISPELKAHLKGNVLTLCTLWKITIEDGRVFGFTDFNKDITFDNLLYEAKSGYSPSAIKTSSGLAVDNLEVSAPLGKIANALGTLTSPVMTEEDIQAGIWDYAKVEIAKCNYEDLSMGVLKLKSGTLGSMVTRRSTYTAELRGMTQPLQQQIGRIFTPACAANLGDKNCRFNLASLTFNGSVTTKIDQHSWVDTRLNQTNSQAVKNITGITNTSPMVVTCPDHGLAATEKVTFSGITGTIQLNGKTLPIAYLTKDTFSITLDGTNLTPYVSGGQVTKLIISEYFKDGVVTWLTGKNAGLKCGVKTYRPNHVTLYDALVYEIQEGDTYKITAGCDKLPSTCHQRFNNIVNFYGFNLVPGQDRLMSAS